MFFSVFGDVMDGDHHRVKKGRGGGGGGGGKGWGEHTNSVSVQSLK